MKKTTPDELVLLYQRTGDSEGLIEQFHNFLNKYFTMLSSDAVNFQDYDTRYFVTCFMQRKDLIVNLRKGKYHTQEALKTAGKVLDYLKFKLRNHNGYELYAELVIPFLQCASAYKQKGRTFEKYIYKVYKYYLKRHLDATLKLDAIDQYGVVYYGQFADEIDLGEEIQEEQSFELKLDLEEGMELTDPRWITGKDCSDTFTSLKPHERYILAKYYYEDHTDKEISRMLPYNPKSIHRIRMRLKKHFMELYNQGDLKWIRLIS